MRIPSLKHLCQNPRQKLEMSFTLLLVLLILLVILLRKTRFEPSNHFGCYLFDTRTNFISCIITIPTHPFKARPFLFTRQEHLRTLTGLSSLRSPSSWGDAMICSTQRYTSYLNSIQPHPDRQVRLG